MLAYEGVCQLLKPIFRTSNQNYIHSTLSQGFCKSGANARRSASD